MSEPDLVVVFDILDAGYKDWWFPAFGIPFVVIGYLLVRFPHQVTGLFNQTHSQRFFRLFSRVWLGFSLFWVVFAFAGTYGTYYLLSSAYVGGNFKTVEGPVENFRPMPVAGHADESFEVAGEKFAYSDFSVMPGFNNARAYGGPVDTGVHVRISHVNGTIVRLEAERSAVEAAANRPQVSLWPSAANFPALRADHPVVIMQRYTWPGFSVLIFVWAMIWRWRGRAHIASDPSLATGYQRMTWGLALWGASPGIIAGLMLLFMKQEALQGSGLSDLILVVLVGIVIARWNYWTFFQDGVAKLLRHPGLIDHELAAKFWPLLVAVGYVGQLLMAAFS